MNEVTSKDNALRRWGIKYGLWSFIIFILISCSTEQQLVQQVFITDTGSKFHLEDCRYLRFSSHMIQLDSAIAKGYTACKVCGPLHDHSAEEIEIKTPNSSIPAQQLSKAVRCTANKINGIQCKRMTKNASGRCWQHEH